MLLLKGIGGGILLEGGFVRILEGTLHYGVTIQGEEGTLHYGGFLQVEPGNVYQITLA